MSSDLQKENERLKKQLEAEKKKNEKKSFFRRNWKKSIFFGGIVVYILLGYVGEIIFPKPDKVNAYVSPVYDSNFSGVVEFPYHTKKGTYFSRCESLTSKDKEAVIMICGDSMADFNGQTFYLYEVKETLNNKPKLTYFFTKERKVYLVAFQEEGPFVYKKKKHRLLEKDRQLADKFFRNYHWVDKL